MKNVGISTLLDLHQQVIDQEDGYWVEIEAWQVEATAAIPHVVRYSLTLHNSHGIRVMGYDNAHAPKTGAGYIGRKSPYDHKHPHAQDQAIRYEFKDHISY